MQYARHIEKKAEHDIYKKILTCTVVKKYRYWW